MKLFIGLLALVTAIGIAAPVQAQPFHVESKGVTYAANSNGGPARVSALVTSTGARIWTTGLFGAPGVPPDITVTALALDKDVLYVSAFSPAMAVTSGFVSALDSISGQILWLMILPGGGIFAPPTVNKDVLYVASVAPTGPSKTTALNAVTGQLIWNTSTPYPAFSSPSVDKDTVVLVTGGFGGYPTFLVLFDAATGQIALSVAVP